LLVSFQVGDHPIYLFPDIVSSLFQFIHLISIDILLVECNICMANCFGHGRTRIIKKLHEIFRTIAMKSFGSICHRGYSTSSDLTDKIEILPEASIIGHFVNYTNEYSCCFPAVKIFKSL